MSGFDIGPSGLIVNGTPTFEQWRDFGNSLIRKRFSLQWAIGDWINYGEAHYGQKYTTAITETKLSYGTLRNYASVAGRVKPQNRVAALSWSHHEAVAKLDPARQSVILQLAHRKRLNRTQTRQLAVGNGTEWEQLVVFEGPLSKLLFALNSVYSSEDQIVKVVAYRRKDGGSV